MNAEEYHQTHHVPSGEEARSSKAAAEKSKGECYEQLGIDNVWGGIPAKNHRGENLLLSILLWFQGMYHSFIQSLAGAGPEYERFLARTKTVEQKPEWNVSGIKNSFLK